MDAIRSNIDEFSNRISKSLEKGTYKKNDFSDLDAFPLIIGKQCLYVMDWHQNEITYVRGVAQMLGYNEREFTKQIILNYFHPDDVNVVKRIIQSLVNHVIKTTVPSHDMFLNIAFRLIKKDNTHLKVLRQTKTYDFDDKGALISNVSFLTDISFMGDNNKVEWDTNYGNIDPKALKALIFNEFLDFFTPRELDVIALINKGKTTKQIADQLFISEHTAYSHRKNILRKSKCHNAQELIAFCNKIGVL